MAKYKSAAAKKRAKAKRPLRLLASSSSLQSQTWWKLVALPPRSSSSMTNQLWDPFRQLSSIAPITYPELPVPLFEKTPTVEICQGVYGSLQKSYLRKLPYDILIGIFEKCENVMDAFALTKAVFPRLEPHWDVRGASMIKRALMIKLDTNALICLPMLKRLIDPKYPALGKEGIRAFALPTSSIPTQLGYDPGWINSFWPQTRTPAYAGKHWEDTFLYWLTVSFKSHMYDRHKGFTPLLLMSCLFGTADTPPCNLVKEYAYQFKSKHVSININPGDLIYQKGGMDRGERRSHLRGGRRSWGGKINERVLLSIKEMADLQRLLALQIFENRSERQILLEMEQETELGAWKPTRWGAERYLSRLFEDGNLLFMRLHHDMNWNQEDPRVEV